MGYYFGRNESSALMMLLFDEMWNASLNEVSDLVFISDMDLLLTSLLNFFKRVMKAL